MNSIKNSSMNATKRTEMVTVHKPSKAIIIKNEDEFFPIGKNSSSEFFPIGKN